MKYKCSNCGKEFHCQPDRDEHELECTSDDICKYKLYINSPLLMNDFMEANGMVYTPEWEGKIERDADFYYIYARKSGKVEALRKLRDSLVADYPYFKIFIDATHRNGYTVKRISGEPDSPAGTCVLDADNNVFEFTHRGDDVRRAGARDLGQVNRPHVCISKRPAEFFTCAFMDCGGRRIRYNKVHDVIGSSGKFVYCDMEHWREAYEKLKDACSTSDDHRIVRVSLVLEDVPQFKIEDTCAMGKTCDYSVYYFGGELYTYAFKEDVELAKKRLLAKTRIACNAMY